ncbi:MAG: hypothetical protein K8T89_06290 [Planctomycetes bacterium]|nr:hypothetical protein [Planctomycetota bacterium]
MTQDDWELGMPEGLAHWDGVHWSWIARLENSIIQQIQYFGDLICLLEADGSILTFNRQGFCSKQLGPNIPTDVHPDACVSAPLFHSFVFDENLRPIIVGDYGLSFELRNSSWSRVRNTDDKRLNTIAIDTFGVAFGGNSGSLYRICGTQCCKVDLPEDTDVVRISTGLDGRAYLLINPPGIFGFAQLDRLETGLIATMNSDVLAMCVVRQNEIIYSTYDGIYLWNGIAAHQLLPNEITGQIELIGNFVAVSLKREEGLMILFDHSNWQKRIVTLDQDYLT